MNRVLRHAIAQGLNPVTAIQMCTLNTAQHFGLEREIGAIAPGRRADIILTSDLVTFPVDHVLASGQTLARSGKLTADIPAYDYPSKAKNTVNMAGDLSAADFDVAATGTQVTARVIGVVENQAPTKALTASLPVEGGRVQMDRANDIAQIALVERHRATGTVQNAFVSGFGYNVDCAMASTVAHDSHHMIVVGTCKHNMAAAANRLRAVGGGITVFREGTEAALVELPIAGLMSDERAEVVAAKAARMMQAMRDCGCTLNNAYMQHSLLALVVIPELRISDIGLVDVTTFEQTSVLLDA